MNAVITFINIIVGITSIEKIVRFNKLLRNVDDIIDAIAMPKRSIRMKHPERRTFVLAVSLIVIIAILCGKFLAN